MQLDIMTRVAVPSRCDKDYVRIADLDGLLSDIGYCMCHCSIKRICEMAFAVKVRKITLKLLLWFSVKVCCIKVTTSAWRTFPELMTEASWRLRHNLNAFFIPNSEENTLQNVVYRILAMMFTLRCIKLVRFFDLFIPNISPMVILYFRYFNI